MIYKKLFTILLFISLVSGCSTNTYRVQYNSVPNGGTLYCRGKAYGYTPYTGSYTINDEARKRGVLIGDECAVKWVSGAVKKTARIFNLKQFPNGVSITVQRPNVPGYQKDAEFALKVQSLRIQQAQANSQAAQARAAANAAYEMSRPKTCYNNGYSVTCY